jgi:hypothetical protein
MTRAWAVIFLALACLLAQADEGYWLFSDPPTHELAAKYNVSLSPEWLDHLRGAVIKIGGGTGSIVSADGLVITNHHVAEGQLHTLSSAQHDYERDGFYAPTHEAELPCQGLEMMVLQSTEDVTARVKAAEHAGDTPAQAEAAHRAVEARIEKESFDRTGLTSEVITLFGGALYDLYRYKKYPEVRLVFAPDGEAAFFGGDPDNFEFPRYDLDIALFRIYDHGKPLATPDHLAFNAGGPKQDELVFVAGHPGTSQRLVTAEELRYQRDVSLPRSLADLQRIERKLTAFSDGSSEHAREAQSALASVANSRKAFHGFLASLSDGALIEAKTQEEMSFRELLAQHPEKQDTLSALDELHRAIAADTANFDAYVYEERFASRSDLVNLGRTLVRAAMERAKPNAERLPAYRDSALPSLEFRLFSGRPFYADLEEVLIRDGLERLAATHDPLADRLLAGQSPQQRASELVRGSHLEDLAYRRKLYTDSAAELRHCGDPMIDFAFALETAARAARDLDDQDADAKHRAYATIYRARVALGRAPAYPDATGTLRLAFGTVNGYTSGDKQIAPFTDFGGLFRHAAEHGNAPPFDLPPAWARLKAKLDPGTPFNFCSSTDILGGNSGSPIVNRAGEFVGIIFDGNRESLAGRYVYDPAVNRSVGVDSAAIIAALRTIYHADAAANELEHGTAP